MNLNKLGLKKDQLNYFEEHYEDSFQLGRVSFVGKNHFKVIMKNGEYLAEITQKLVINDMIPVIGDWVVINDLDNFKLIIGILPRFSELKRQSKVHETISQYIATNLDEVFVVMGLDGDFNLNRLERYVMQITESRANPIIILNKLDTVDNYQEKVQLVKQRLEDVPVIATSVTMKTNLNKIKDRFYEGMTATLVGSSGVGKSSIANYLMGKDALKVNSTRESDSKGRHTTTHRGLYFVNPEGLIIDTPGMRSLAIYGDKNDLHTSFKDISEFAQSCKFNDCSHEEEPGCRVQEAIENGELDEDRLNNYKKLLKEIEYNESKTSKKALAEKKEEWKNKTKRYKNHNKIIY